LKNEVSGRIRFFADEKFFTVDAKINRRNDQWLAYNPEDVSFVAKTKFPVYVLGMSNESDVMPLHFFKKGKIITKEVYLRVLMDVVKPWMETVASERPYIF